MSTPEDSPHGDSERSADDEDQSFQLPLPDESAEGPKLRRRLFGIRAADVRTEIGARDAEIAELRRDVAALWLAFGQHERTIRQMLETLQQAGGVAVDPPGGRADRAASAPRDPGATEAGPESPSIGEQLSGLDQVLAAIEQATRTLERGYAEEIEAADATDDAGTESVEGDEDGEQGRPGADD